jgi:hypothetical protein
MRLRPGPSHGLDSRTGAEILALFGVGSATQPIFDGGKKKQGT